MLRALAGLILAIVAWGLAVIVLDLANAAPPLPKPPAEATPPNAPAPIASYTWNASLDPEAHEVRGEGRITWKNGSTEPQSAVWVHLYLNAFKTDDTRFLSNPVGGFRGTNRLASYGRIDVGRFAIEGVDVWPEGATTPDEPDDETDIEVRLPKPIGPGEEVVFDVAFVATLPSISLRTGFSDRFHMVAQWFPKLARLEPDGRWVHFPFERMSEFYADFGDYDVTIEVPKGFTVGATGRLEEERDLGERTSVRYLQKGVIDFAFTAWDEFEEITTTTEDGVALRALFPPGHRRAAEAEIDVTRRGLSYFGERFGPYPYETLTLVHPPASAQEAGGMEYPTLITTGGPWWLPWTGVRGLELVTVHELGHQWFYGLVATDEHHHPFLDEGLNTYADLSAMGAFFGDGSLLDAAGWSVGLPAVYRMMSIDKVRNAPVAQAAPAFDEGSDYGGLVYYRTATVLTMLERVYGPSVAAGLEAYTREYRFRHPGPEHLLNAIEVSAGEEAATALRTALFDRGWVNFRVAELAPRSAIVRREGTLRLPVDVDLERSDGARERRSWEGPGDEIVFDAGEGADFVRVQIDPEGRVLCDADLLDNAAALEPAGIAPRVWERTAFAFATVLSMVGP